MVRIVLAVVRPPIGTRRAVGLARSRYAHALCRVGLRRPRVLPFDELVQQDCVESSTQR
jgi:hypothetical protein